MKTIGVNNKLDFMSNAIANAIAIINLPFENEGKYSQRFCYGKYNDFLIIIAVEVQQVRN